MTNITCAISGVKFECSYLPGITIPHTEGYFHPIFAVSHITLYSLYTKHCKGELTSIDSYLTFLALLHSSGKVVWKHPVTCNPSAPSTKKLIETNFAQLLRVIDKTNAISHPSFRQPIFKVHYDNADLGSLTYWIAAWEANIEDFYNGIASAKEQESLQQVENKLSCLILSGESPAKYAHVIADWADRAAEFPAADCELWKQTIRSCFNTAKMFNTPLSLIKEISDYCAVNIDVGSIHFHTLSRVLKEGVKRHISYLGETHLIAEYTLLPTVEGDVSPEALQSQADIAIKIASAPDKPPVQADYSNSLEFLKAKLAYRMATSERQRQSLTGGINL